LDIPEGCGIKFENGEPCVDDFTQNEIIVEKTDPEPTNE